MDYVATTKGIVHSITIITILTEHDCYLNSILYKGPLLKLSSKLEDNLSPAGYITIKAYKTNIKSAILK